MFQNGRDENDEQLVQHIWRSWVGEHSTSTTGAGTVAWEFMTQTEIETELGTGEDETSSLPGTLHRVGSFACTVRGFLNVLHCGTGSRQAYVIQCFREHQSAQKSKESRRVFSSRAAVLGMRAGPLRRGGLHRTG